MRRFGLTAVLILGASTWAAAGEGHGGHHGGFSGYSGGWRSRGFSGFSSFGYSSIGVVGGLGSFTYYRGPAFGYFGDFYPGYNPYYAYPTTVPVVSYTAPPAPIIVNGIPAWPGLDPGLNPALSPRVRVADPAGRLDAADQIPQAIRPSNAEAKRKSIRHQAQGDEYFIKANFLQAFAHYKQASSTAPDLPQPRYRMAIALAAMSRFGPAADEFKRLMRIAPDWPVQGERLDDVFGPDNDLARLAVLSKVAEWVREDVRDPERLYLMGVLLHFNEDYDKARPFFEAVAVLAEEPDYVQPFFAPPQNVAPGRGAPANRREAGQPDEEPVPRPQAVVPAPAAPMALSGPRLLPLGDPPGAARR